MATKKKAAPRGAAATGTLDTQSVAWETPPWTTEERLSRIQTLGQQIQTHIEFMSAVENLPGTSAEAKERAVAVFYERLVILERQLGRIREELQLG